MGEEQLINHVLYELIVSNIIDQNLEGSCGGRRIINHLLLVCINDHGRYRSVSGGIIMEVFIVIFYNFIKQLNLISAVIA